MKRLLPIGIIAKLLWLLSFLAGCGSSTEAATAPFDSGSLNSLFAIVQQDIAIVTPALPDDLKPSPGSTQPDTTGRDADPQPPAKNLPVVLVFGPPGCPPCVTAIDALNATGRYTASKAAITPAIAKIANAWNQGAYPIATFRDAKGDERFVVWRGLADFEIRYNRTMGLKAKAAAEDTRKLPVSASSSPAAVVYSTGYMWPVKQLREHLREHGYSRKQIEGMTDAECGRAHDRIHGWY